MNFALLFPFAESSNEAGDLSWVGLCNDPGSRGLIAGSKQNVPVLLHCLVQDQTVSVKIRPEAAIGEPLVLFNKIVTGRLFKLVKKSNERAIYPAIFLRDHPFLVNELSQHEIRFFT